MKILFFGDIVARPGRLAVAQVLPEWQKDYSPDVIIGCIDNLAHGKGATEKTVQELLNLGFHAFTTGDHVLNSDKGEQLVGQENLPIVRPLNLPESTPGLGWRIIEIADQEIVLVHLIGQVFLSGDYISPFKAIDNLLNSSVLVDKKNIIVDIHAEATSEKVALGWYLNGRVTAVLGTHTHIPTCDEWIMPQGTAYITDVGMTGIRESVLGVKTDIILNRFVYAGTDRFEPAETGTVLVRAVIIDFNPDSGHAKSIKRLEKTVTIT